MKKIALITGASSGIGLETALLMKKEGFTVYASARRSERMQVLAAQGIHLIEMDLTSETSVKLGVENLLSREGRVDVLVNNAGYGSFGSLEEVSIEEAKRQFEVNVFGLARLIQLVLPGMRQQRSGRIINISSMGGRFGEPHGAWYHATKFALEGLSDSLRMELKQFNIDVIVIQPGAIASEWSDIAAGNLIKVSGQGPYKELALKHASLLRETYKRASPPMVIARTILKAATASRPRTRYAAGAGARLLLFVRKLLPDRVFDSVFLSQIKNK